MINTPYHHSERVDCFKKEPIAIVGIGCRFPGGADRSEPFGKQLKYGVVE